MRLCYLDCSSGISGDMALGAFLDAGVALADVEAELRRLDLSGYALRAEKTTRQQLTGTRFLVSVDPHTRQPARNLKAIVKMVNATGLKDRVKRDATAIFQKLGEAEAAVHGKDLESVHFHEVGAVDSIVDIVGTAIAVSALGLERFAATPVAVGSGTVTFSHGTFPVPAPATMRLLTGVEITRGRAEGELTTPTGAAILTHYCRDFSGVPRMRVEKVGYGFGHRETPGQPNALRAVIGEAPAGWQRELMQVIEANIDDLNPQFYERACERLFEAGALDVYLTPLLMKKGRPGTLLTVLCHPDDGERLIPLIFEETTTFGMRSHLTEKVFLDRKSVEVGTRYGTVTVKIGLLDGKEICATPEYESVRAAARKAGVSVREVYVEAQRQARR